MVNVFCTRKSETFISVKKKEENYNDTDENWICNLVPIGGKKSLYFIDKNTLYSVLLLNVKKKDLENIESLFIEEFLSQLKTDEILNSEMELSLRNRYKNLKFYETDNDQKTLGTLRDNMYHIKTYISDKADKIHFAKDIMSKINQIPLGGRKYANAKELMKLELDKNT
jgi:hypothetical protein